MLYDLYLVLIILSFILFGAALFTKKLLSKTILVGFALILFSALAMASANVEIVHCRTYVSNSTETGDVTSYDIDNECENVPFFFQENMWMFGMFALFSGVIFMITSFQSFQVMKGKRGIVDEE